MPRNFDLSDYVTVAQRLEKFWAEYPEGRIATELLPAPAGIVVIKAAAYRNIADPNPAATGHAHEVEGQGMVNTTSAMENCETSAVGRALSLMGYEISKAVASREEMQGAANRSAAKPPASQSPPTPPTVSAPAAPTNLPGYDQQTKITFGKYRGKSLAEADTGYLNWLHNSLEAKLDDPEYGASNQRLYGSVGVELKRREDAAAQAAMGVEVDDGIPSDEGV